MVKLFKNVLLIMGKKQMKKNEYGRSMVEMLGVLAIIGILSVTGIYGYTIAMRKYRANEIVQAASVLAIMAQSANSGEGECVKLSDIGFFSSVTGLGVDMVADPSVIGGRITVNIELNEEDEALCAMIKNTANENPAYEIDICSDAVVSCDEL